jgi:very-short-patch-repair endonuclease
MNIEREEVFKWIQKNEFEKIVEILKGGQKIINEDPILVQAIDLFFKELIITSNLKDSNKVQYIFQQLSMLHEQKLFTFSEDQFEKIMVHLAKNAKSPEEAEFYANKVANNAECASIIESINANKPKELTHGQDANIKVHEIITTNLNITKSIFKSKQERLFFLALRNCFPLFYIYPNIALSTIINLIAVEDILDGKEKKFYYNTTIDFVVIDQFNDFKPMFAVELDSEWHRLNNQQSKDEIKNKIIKQAGLPFYRIENMNKYKSVEDFEQVILDTIHTTSK